ncbi:MAG: VWA domain-containing protein [Gemmataceae bacterium]|nr:VWA domain-containing protein [Gemmataceae bacterium]
MNEPSPSASSPQQPIDIQIVRRTLQNPAIARELFLPLDMCRWDGQRVTLGEGHGGNVAAAYSGVRLQPPDPSNRDLTREKVVQSDLVSLIKSLTELRKTPQFAGAVISSEAIVGRDPGGVQRARFGLYVPPDGRFKNEGDAARECQRQIASAMKRGGFRVESPFHFDPNGGFRGLSEWAGKVRLQRKKLPWLLILIGLVALCLLALVPMMCKGPSTPRPPSTAAAPPDSKPADLFGTKVDTDSLVILLDKSGSMEAFFPNVRDEAQRLFDERLANKQECFVDLITYDSGAHSVLGGMKQLTPDVGGKLIAYLHNLRAGGGTDLQKGIDLAAKEVKAHGRKTTLVVITDGEDGTIQGMVTNKASIRQQFGGAEFLLNSTTPRLFDQTGSAQPQNQYETQLKQLSEAFNGRFGPNRGGP